MASSESHSSQQDANPSRWSRSKSALSKRPLDPASVSDPDNPSTPKRQRRIPTNPKVLDHDQDDGDDDHDQPSDSSDQHDDFTPKASRASSGRGRGRGRGRGTARGRPSVRGTGRNLGPGLPDSSTRKPSKPRKTRVSTKPSNRNLQLADRNGHQTDHDDLELDPQIPRGEYEISDDNDLFNTIRMGTSAIQPTLEDWMEVYQGSSQGNDEDSKGEAISQFINFVLRCCGCNCSIDKYQALDLDAVTDTLDDIQQDFRTVPSQAYPLIVKSGKSVSNNFRKNLISLTHQLILLADSNSVLYDDQFINSIQSYLVSMSSSTFRSFRHTSTVISLFGFVSPMCELLVGAKKELNSLSRKVELESAKTHAYKNSQVKRDQLIEWQKRKKQVLEQKTCLEGFIGDFFDGVFVHRYRDADPSIRAECVQALGQWMTAVPDYFLDSNYLRYIGWVLTDSNKDARNEALKALSILYSKEENIGVMQHFTSRFRSRLTEMATGETDFTTRCLAINIATQIDRHGLLGLGQRKQLGRLIYHEDSRVRKAASTFFGNLFEEALDARKMRLDAVARSTEGNHTNAKARTEEHEKQIAFKCLARLLLKLEKESKPGADQGSSNEVESSHSEEEPELPPNTEDVVETADENPGIGGSFYRNDLEQGRIDFAVEDLWNRVEILHEWQALCRYLLLDHTASTNRSETSSMPVKPGRTKASRSGANTRISNEDEGHEDFVVNSTSVEGAYKLSESEETILVEVLVASIRKFGSSLTESEALKRRKKKKKRLQPGVTDDEIETTDDEANVARRAEELSEEELTHKVELTRGMVDLLPKLWSKFMTDPVRLTEVFRIPKLMSLNMYLDLRMISAFEEMWDTMIKQYLKQQHMGVIQMISSTIAHVLSEAKSLDHINQVKILKLHEALISSLNDLTIDKSDLGTEEFEDDQIVSLTLLLHKIRHLFRQSDLSSILRSAGLKGQSASPLDLINSIANRGRLAHSNESNLIETALEILQLNFTWTSASIYRSIIATDASIDVVNPVSERDSTSDMFAKLQYGMKIRDNLVNLLLEYSISTNTIITESVKRSAFIHLLNTYLLCQGALIPEHLRLECDDETQSKFANLVEAEIEKFILENNINEEDEERLEGSGDDGDESDHVENNCTKRGNKDKRVLAKRPRPNSFGFQTKSKSSSVKELLRMEGFDLLITTYAKSIRCGLVHFRHSVVIIQHFTRLTKIFDITAELLIATLSDGIANHSDHVDLVVACLVDIFKASFELYLSQDTYSEEQFIRVARLLQSVTIHRGPRMSYKSRLDSNSWVKLHLGCIQWLIGQATDPEPEPPLMNKLGVMFRGLRLLLLGTDGPSCLKIKAELERLVEERALSIPASKSWDPYQHYLKRLITTMAKDPNIKRAARLALRRQGGAETSAGEDGVANGTNQIGFTNGLDPHNDPSITKTKRKSQTRGRRSNPRAGDLKEGPVDGLLSTPVGTDVPFTTKSRPSRSARLSSVSPGPSSHAPTSVHSDSRRASSVVSVLVPSEPKRKRIESTEKRSKTKERGKVKRTASLSSASKRTRLDAVVVENNAVGRSRIDRKIKGGSTSRKGFEDPSESGPDRTSRIPDSSGSTTNETDEASAKPLTTQSEDDDDGELENSSTQSDASLAQIKRKSRRKSLK